MFIITKARHPRFAHNLLQDAQGKRLEKKKNSVANKIQVKHISKLYVTV